MPRHEPSRRQTAGEPPPSKVKMRLDEKGKWVPILLDVEPVDEAPAEGSGPGPDDPRPATMRFPDAG
jgi:hypothetical protein